MKDIIFKSDSARKVLKNLLCKRNYMAQISREENITLPYCGKIVKELIKQRFIKVVKVGRRQKDLVLTKKGRIIALKLSELGGML